MDFVDRIDETARLNDALRKNKSSLVVIYGRRRLGKSTLIKRVLSEKDVYFLADRSESLHQRTLLSKVLAQVFPDFDKLSYPIGRRCSEHSIIGQIIVLHCVWTNSPIL